MTVVDGGHSGPAPCSSHPDPYWQHPGPSETPEVSLA